MIGLVVFLLTIGIQLVNAQTKQITGVVKHAEDGTALPGVSVVIKGTTIGASTDIDGKYSIKAKETDVLIFSFVGMVTKEVTVGKKTKIDVSLKTESVGVNEVVVTALGVTREKKSLGYAVTEIGGEMMSESKESNVVNSLSGKVAGVHIRQANTMGGSANVVIRGTTSLMNNNQALFVVDGVPIDNSNTNSLDQVHGHGGYDYGNAAADINPEDIETVSVLKGAAATALYGARAANGVILITTKSGKKQKGIGVTVNSGITWSSINKNTMPEYQYEYGAGYSQDFTWGPDTDWSKTSLEGLAEGKTFVNFNDDASYGPAFDPNLMVVHWDAMDPAADNFLEERPWVAPKNEVYDFFDTAVKYSNSVSLEGGSDMYNFRLTFTNNDETGILPNSSIKKTMVGGKAKYKFNDKFSTEFSGNFVRTKGEGRFGTGYDEDNPMQNIAQWGQVNLDYDRLKNYKSNDGRHLGWNYNSPTSHKMAFTNNPYWTRYMNAQEDERNRFYGYIGLEYKYNKDLTFVWKTSLDSYQEEQKEKVAVGSHKTSGFTSYRRTFSEMNSDFMARYKKQINDVSVNALAGVGYRHNRVTSMYGKTQGGLVVPLLYTTSNSVVPTSPTERDNKSDIKSFYASASAGYKNMVYIEGSVRVDQSSTLPDDDNTYTYPAVSLSFIPTELPALKELSFLTFSKLRVNYAEVGNDTQPYNVNKTYDKYTNHGSVAPFTLPSTNLNPNLKSERTKSLELGLEANFLNNRFGFDFAWYKANTFDQIIPIKISPTAGYSATYVNAGELENRGLELSLHGTPVQTGDFTWNMNVNWTKNENEVKELFGDVRNIELTSAWDVTINATLGESYGAIRGTDFVRINGKPVVDASGYYKKTKEVDKVIGNVTPEWNAGITNTFSYKGFTLRTLIDIQHGGDIYSVDRKYGLATGILKETAGLNDKGFPIRDLPSMGGGVRFANAVKEDGSPNDIYAYAGGWGGAFYYGPSPTARYVYDASYVKLREVSLTYRLPKSIMDKTFLTKASLSLIGRNLLILHKNTPGFDPESGLSSGNFQGIANCAYPTTRTYGFNVTLGF